jgi:NADH-quinone oxidoreductase subunit L
MLELLWLVPTLPFAGFVILFVTRGELPKPVVAVVGAAAVAGLIASEFLRAPPAGHVFRETLWTWMQVGGFTPSIGLYLDALSLVMVLVITGVGFLIHLYSAEFMFEDEGYSRYFAYMNLFVTAMLVLVLADNLLFLYLGWEGVGLCSYLLIGFWYRDPANGLAARKAFVVTRAGDVAFVIGLFLLFTQLGTLDIQQLMTRASEQWGVNSGVAIAAAALLLGGAVGKSAQLPLQTWLPDAMAGPTPVSALIHAATMVTAGMYLIARTHVLFTQAPTVHLAVAVIGALTLLLASFSALTQRDIKRVLAYSTISQIGYMFLALGVGAWAAGIFHFMTHAFFKALLFLSSGVIIHALHHEHDIYKMGALWRRLPSAFWTFLAGSASLAALPVITAGFYSKDHILWLTWSSSQSGARILWLAGIVGAFLTAVYIFRVVFVAFFGEAKTPVEKRPGFAMLLPVILLSVLSIVGGLVQTPQMLGHIQLFSHLLDTALPAPAAHEGGITELVLEAIAMAVSVGGVAVAGAWFLARPALAARMARARLGAALGRLWDAGWGFDWLYDRLFVRPFVWIARINRDDVVDSFYDVVAFVTRASWHAARATQNGQMRWYAAGLALGSVFVIGVALFL